MGFLHWVYTFVFLCAPLALFCYLVKVWDFIFLKMSFCGIAILWWEGHSECSMKIQGGTSYFFLFFHSSTSDACSFHLVFHMYLFAILYPLNTEQGTNNEAIWERHKINEMVCVFNLHIFIMILEWGSAAERDEWALVLARLLIRACNSITFFYSNHVCCLGNA